MSAYYNPRTKRWGPTTFDMLVGLAELVVVLLLMAAVAHAQQATMPMQGSTSAEGSHTFGGTTFNGITVSWNSATAARYFMVFDKTSLPSNGSTTACGSSQTAGCLAYCYYVPQSSSAPNSFTLDFTSHPFFLRNGVTVAMSTGAGCGTLTADGSNDFFYSQVR